MAEARGTGMALTRGKLEVASSMMRSGRFGLAGGSQVVVRCGNTGGLIVDRIAFCFGSSLVERGCHWEKKRPLRWPGGRKHSFPHKNGPGLSLCVCV